MKITVKPLKGDNFEVDVAEEATVEQVKDAICAIKPDFPADLQKLIHSGRILKDDGKVSDLGIKPGEFIVVMLTKAKPPDTPPAPAAAPAAAPAPTPAGAPANDADPAAAAAANLVTGTAMESTITQLCDMGFSRPEVERCLMAAFNNPDRAVDYLMNGIPEGVLNDAGGDGGGAARPPPGAGGGGAPAPAPGGGGGGGVVIPPQLAELRNNPQFAQLGQMIAQNPAMLAQLLPALQQSHPQLVEAIRANPQAFFQMIAETGGGAGAGGNDPVAAMLAAAGGGGGGGGGPGPTVIHLTEQEREAVQRLAALGFDPQMAAQAYLACEKNEELAANFLFDSANDD